MPLAPEVAARMQAAQDVATKDLTENVDIVAVKAIAAWVARHYMAAGYKRLCRALVQVSLGEVLQVKKKE